MSPEDAVKINQLLDLVEAQGTRVNVQAGEMRLTPVTVGQPTSTVAIHLARNLRLGFDITDIQRILTERAHRGEHIAHQVETKCSADSRGLPMSKKIRRVVTGHTPDGKSVFVSDDAPPRVVSISGMKDFSITPVWATDYGMTAVPGSVDPTPAMTTFVPGHGGTRFLVTVIPPHEQGLEPGTEPVAEEMVAKLPGLAQAMEPDHPGMHTTDTVDYDIIISGELWLELDDGKEVRLKPGDIVIQNGTRHTWRNKGKKPCVMYSALVGAPRR